MKKFGNPHVLEFGCALGCFVGSLIAVLARRDWVVVVTFGAIALWVGRRAVRSGGRW